MNEKPNNESIDYHYRISQTKQNWTFVPTPPAINLSNLFTWQLEVKENLAVLYLICLLMHPLGQGERINHPRISVCSVWAYYADVSMCCSAILLKPICYRIGCRSQRISRCNDQSCCNRHKSSCACVSCVSPCSTLWTSVATTRSRWTSTWRRWDKCLPASTSQSMPAYSAYLNS